MDKLLFQDLQPEEKYEALNNHADAIEEIGYMKPFTPEEIDEFKEAVVKNTIEASELQQELKSIQEDYKSRINPLTQEISLKATFIKNSAQFIKEPCFKVIDHYSKQVGYYNADGVLVSERPTRPEESQSTILSMTRNA